MKINLTIKHLILVLCILLLSPDADGQLSKSAEQIIQEIRNLEDVKDPKCHATANRLEDFIYGTPLSEEARNMRIEIQKAFIYLVKKESSEIASANNSDSIYMKDIKPVVESLVSFGRKSTGEWYILNDGEDIIINANDMRQYSSVSYAYRSLLSVEQDMLLSFDDNLPFAQEVIEPLYAIVNLLTLGTLKMADDIARSENRNVLSKNDVSQSWIQLFDSKIAEGNLRYSAPIVSEENISDRDYVIDAIIKQKQESYTNYNNISSSVFLRNIQVYFARQKWPKERSVSDKLRGLYLESMIGFTKSLLLQSDKYADIEKSNIIRINHVQKAITDFTPFEVNMFEDVIFFPALLDENITIESYDLDAFRDSGWHWQMLSHALDDLRATHNFHIDPNSAELIVEGVAQMGVLLFRIAGEKSKEKGETVLDTSDITTALTHIQDLIFKYSTVDQEPTSKSNYKPKVPQIISGGFSDANQESNINYTHKSSDWLSRYIRSYVYSDTDSTVKLGIPPAFGGAGVAADDIDNDGDIDILLLGGLGNSLFINDGDGTFSLSDNSTVLSNWNAEAGSYSEPRQPIIVDFDNDGYKDIFISYVNDNHCIYRNIDGTNFENYTEKSNLGGVGLVGGPATAFDYDNDGLLDIFIGYFGNYMKGVMPTLGRNDQNGDANKLFRNMGDFVFMEVPLAIPDNRNNGWTQAMGHTDLNVDGLQDIIVGNDFGTNEYYINQGNGEFKELSKNLGTDKPSYTMNVGITDINKDLVPDLYISNIVVMQKDEKYVSPNAKTTMKFDPEKMANIRTVEANDFFISDKTSESLHYNNYDKIGRGYTSTGWSWDADFFDYDNDGDVDLYCLNGMNDFSVYSEDNPYYFPSDNGDSKVKFAKSNKERNVFFVNNEGQFINEANALNMDINGNARSAAYLDYDNDGDLDIITNNYHEEAIFSKNNLDTNSNWIKILLHGDPSASVNRDAIGAVIIANSKNHKNLWREVHSTDGYLSSHPKVQHIGLGSDNRVDLIIKWPDQLEVKFRNIDANKTYRIKYPDVLTQY